MTTPAPKDLTIYQGDSFDLLVRVKGRNAATGVMEYLNLTGVTPKAQVRANEAATQVLAEITCTITDQVATPGGVLLHLDPAITQTIALTTTQKHKWDLQLQWSATEVRTVLKGNVSVESDVTRA